MRGHIVHRVCQVAIAAVEATIPEVVVPDTVFRDQVPHSLAPRRLTESGRDVIRGEKSHLIAVAEVPDRVDHRHAMVRLRIRAREVTPRILGDHDEWLVRGHRLSHRERPSTELLHEVPVADIREVVHQGIVDIMLMSAYVNEQLTIKEGLFKDSHVTPAARANPSRSAIFPSTIRRAAAMIRSPEKRPARLIPGRVKTQPSTSPALSPATAAKSPSQPTGTATTRNRCSS